MLYLHYSEKVRRLTYRIGVSDRKVALGVAKAIQSGGDAVEKPEG